MAHTAICPNLLRVLIALILLPALSTAADYSPADLEYRNPPVAGKQGITVTYVGTTTAVISDGETTLMTDGYFSRVSIDTSPEGGGLVEPNVPVIKHMLDALDLDRVAAVLVVHSHFDHAMDAPIVASLTGADLVGSESTAMIGRGLNLPEGQIRVVQPGATMHYGEFTVRFFLSKHFPLGEPYATTMLGNSVDAPLRPPARFDDYKEGSSFSILLEHPLGDLLIQGSAGYLPGALKGLRADAILLGTGGLDSLPREEQDAYYREIVLTTGAKRLFPVHWDRMTTPLTEPLVAAGGFSESMQFLADKQAITGVTFAILPLGEPVLLEF